MRVTTRYLKGLVPDTSMAAILLGHFYRPQLRTDAGTDLAGADQRHNHLPDLPDNGDADHGAYRLPPKVFHGTKARLQGEHHTMISPVIPTRNRLIADDKHWLSSFSIQRRRTLPEKALGKDHTSPISAEIPAQAGALEIGGWHSQALVMREVV